MSRYTAKTIPSPGWYDYEPGWLSGHEASLTLIFPSCLEDRSKLKRGTYKGPLSKKEEAELRIHSWEWHEQHPNAAII